MQLGHKTPLAIERYLLPAGIAILMTLIYLPLIVHWYDGWLSKSISTEHDYFSHGIIGLPFAAYIAWTKRKYWQRLLDRSNPLGVALLTLGGIFYLSHLPDFVNLSFPLVLVGLCLWLKGRPGLNLQKFPLLLAFLATPNQIPYLLAPYTLPLQTFIAGTAAFILSQLGIDVAVNGIYLFVGGRIVEVAPYCAGLKMLFTSLYVALMLLYWTGAIAYRNKATLFLASTVVISVSANILRNTLLTFFHGTGQTSLFDWLHEGWGGDLYSACMLGLLVLLISWIERAFPPGIVDLELDDELDSEPTPLLLDDR